MGSSIDPVDPNGKAKGHFYTDMTGQITLLILAACLFFS
jgi:hypothetical protein